MARTSVSSVQQFVKGFEAHPFFIGIDVHKRSYYLALRRIDGKTVTLACPADPSGLVRVIQRLCICVGSVVYEAGPTGFGLARTLREAGIQTLMAAPSRIPRAVTAGAKTDRLDCIRLADYGAKGLIRSIAIPSRSRRPNEAFRGAVMILWIHGAGASSGLKAFCYFWAYRNRSRPFGGEEERQKRSASCRWIRMPV